MLTLEQTRRLQLCVQAQELLVPICATIALIVTVGAYSPSVGKPLTHYPSLHLQIMIAIQVACVICVERMRCIAMLLRQKEQLGTTRHLVHR